MFIGFVGTPGSGKSYEAVQKILDNIKLGRKIYTNIEGLDNPSCKQAMMQYCNITDFQLEKCVNKLTDEEIMYPHLHCEMGSLVVIDEAHKLFSNRDWASDKNKVFSNWASTHRHEGYDVVLVTQSLEKIDKHVRSLIEWTYLFRKVNMFGGAIQKKYICSAYAGDDHSGKPMKRNVRTYDQKVFRCYQSYVASDVKELGFMKHVNILKHPIFYSIPIVLALTIFMFSKSEFANGNLLGVDPKKISMQFDAGIEKVSAASESVPLSQALPVASSSINEPVKVQDPDRDMSIYTQKIRSQVRMYQNNAGHTVWTNNEYQPQGYRYIKDL